MEEIIRLKANYLGDGQHKIICPSCNQTRKKKNQKTLSVKVNSDSIVYQCWHCSASGEVKYNYNSKRESKVIDMFEVDRAKETWQNLGKSAMSFLKNRGISEKTATHFNIKTVHFLVFVVLQKNVIFQNLAINVDGSSILRG